jgi:hypothetical protein
MRRLLLVTIVGLAGLAGCGDEEAPAGEDTVRQALERALTTRDSVEKCNGVFTARLVAEVYGSLARCEEAERPHPNERPAKALRLQGTRVEESRATSRVTLVGGVLSGATGQVELVRDSERWKIDRFATDFLRAQLRVWLLWQVHLSAEGPGLQEAAARRCADEQINGIPEQRFRRLAHAFVAEREDEAHTLINLIIVCLAQPGTGTAGQSYLRAQLVQEIVEYARREGADEATLTCIRRRLRTEISDQDVVAHANRDKASPPPATRRIAAVVDGCRRSS